MLSDWCYRKPLFFSCLPAAFTSMIHRNWVNNPYHTCLFTYLNPCKVWQFWKSAYLTGMIFYFIKNTVLKFTSVNFNCSFFAVKRKEKSIYITACMKYNFNFAHHFLFHDKEQQKDRGKVSKSDPSLRRATIDLTIATGSGSGSRFGRPERTSRNINLHDMYADRRLFPFSETLSAKSVA